MLKLAVSGALVILLLEASLITAQDAQDESPPPQLCDVIGAANCFIDLSNGPDPRNVAMDIDMEVVQPCKNQLNEATTMDACLVGDNGVLKLCDVNGLPDQLKTYVNVMIDYCKEVDACNEFEDHYLTVIECTDGVRSTMREATRQDGQNGTIQECNNFLNCLDDASNNCQALNVVAATEYEDFRRTCSRVDVTAPEKFDPKPPTGQYCSGLDSKIMKIKQCHDDFLTKGNFTDSTRTVYIPDACPLFHDFFGCAYDESIPCNPLQITVDTAKHQAHKIMSAFCGQADEGVCNFAGVKGCYKGFKDSFFKLDGVVNEEGPLNITYVRSKFLQNSAWYRTFEALCRDEREEMREEVSETFACLKSNLAGCPESAVGDFYEKAAYVQLLCAEIAGCTQLPEIINNIEYCFGNATVNLTAAASNDTLSDEDFHTETCSTIDSTVYCLADAFATCPQIKGYTGGYFYQIEREVKKLCPHTHYKQLKENVTMELIIEDFIDCGDITEKAADMQKCIDQFVRSLAIRPSSNVSYCKASEHFEVCMTRVSKQCKAVALTAEQIVATLKGNLGKTCDTPPEDSDDDDDKNTDGDNDWYFAGRATGGPGISAVLLIATVLIKLI